MKEKYKDGSSTENSNNDISPINSDACLFRPNIVIDEQEPWVEEEY